MKIQVELKDFTPLLDTLVNEHGVVTAAVYGAVWRYAQMKDRVCRASLEKIAGRVKVSSKTAERHIKKLCKAGYLEDLTPKIKNKPHVYIVTGKAELTGAVSSGIGSDRESYQGQTESLTRSDRESYQGQTESPLKKHIKKDKEDILPPQNSQPNGNAPSSPDHRAEKIERLANAISKTAGNDNPLFIKGSTLLALDICKLCGLDIMTIVSRKTQEALVSITIALYMHKVSKADLSKFSSWWYDNKWQGQKGQPPTPEAIGDSWGQFEAQKVVNVPTISTDGGFYV